MAKLTRMETTLQVNGRAVTIWYEYDHEGDILELIFRSAEATCAVELTESIILRFDWDTAEPLSLSFISFSRLVQPAEYGEQHFRLLVEQWPDEAQEKMWATLRTAPLNEFLQVGSYMPPHAQPCIPVAAIKRPQMIAQP